MKKFLRYLAPLCCFIVMLVALTVTASAAESGNEEKGPHCDPDISTDSKISIKANINCNPDLPKLMFGQEVVAIEGAVYYETADFAGSGNHGTANNCYTSHLYIAGFARIDPDTTRLVAWKGYQRDDVPVGELAPDFVDGGADSTILIATYTPGFTTGSVGWFRACDLKYRIGELTYLHDNNVNQPDLFQENDIYYHDPDHDQPAVTPENVAGAIQNATTKGQKTALFLDASGSVMSYSAAIAAYAEQVDTADYVAVFAGDCQEIKADEYSDQIFNLTGGTNIYGALNTLPDEPFDVVILVTDTWDNRGYTLKERDNIAAFYILSVVDTGETYHTTASTIGTKWHVSPVVRRLDME